jgi:hypothetical protein
VLPHIRHWLGLDSIEEDLDTVRAEQRRIAEELEQVKRLHWIDLDIDVEQTRGMHLPPDAAT